MLARTIESLSFFYAYRLLVSLMKLSVPVREGRVFKGNASFVYESFAPSRLCRTFDLSPPRNRLAIEIL